MAAKSYAYAGKIHSDISLSDKTCLNTRRKYVMKKNPERMLKYDNTNYERCSHYGIQQT